MERRRILFVCTANICRSPTAEYIARDRFGNENFHTRSAGFLQSDHSVPKEIKTLMTQRNVDIGGHRSYRVDLDTVRASDLIFTMEARHVLEVTLLDRAALAKTIPLKEAAKLVSGPESIEDFLTRINAERDPQTYLGGYAFDVSDPYRKRMKLYERAVEEIDDLVATVFSALS
jgi:protein-tyrosine phosphatase